MRVLSIWWIFGLLLLIACGAVAMINNGNENLAKAGFLVMGGFLTIAAAMIIELRKRHVQVKDLARVLYAELTHLVARCVFDSESPWKGYWPKDAAPRLKTAANLRKFAPAVPTIYNATAGQLALLPGKAPQTLIEFHYRLSALRREIDNTVAGANPSDSANVPIGPLRQVGLRFRQTLEPSLKALEALAPLVADSAEMEEHARVSYYETRPDSDMKKPSGSELKTCLLSLTHWASRLSWSRRFEDPIPLPDGTQLKTLREAISYLVKAIPEAERDMPEVLTAAEMLTNAAERESAWVFLARIATLRAIHRNDVRVFNPDRKDHHWGKHKLKRDQ
jgi:hypothetical protein